jgi:hypothetical protein
MKSVLLLSLVLFAACSPPPHTPPETPPPSPGSPNPPVPMTAPAPTAPAVPPAAAPGTPPSTAPVTPAPAEPTEEAGPTGDAEAPAPPTPIPATYPAVVTALREQATAARAALTAGKLKDIHPIARGMMDLATAAPGKAASLPADARGKVALKALDLKKQADAMHDAADRGDAAAAAAALTAVTADIDALAAMGK